MGEFLDVALGFPTALFSFLLVVVVGYWALVLFGAVGMDDGVDAETGGGAGFLAGIGLGGLPSTVVLSLLIVVAWFVSLAGSVLLDRPGWSGALLAVLSTVLLLLALGGAWLVTRLLARPLRHFFQTEPPVSRNAFVGRVCVIRTGLVSVDFGQAEVTSPDGSSAVVQVRQAGEDTLGAGSRALIYDYDADRRVLLGRCRSRPPEIPTTTPTDRRTTDGCDHHRVRRAPRRTSPRRDRRALPGQPVVPQGRTGQGADHLQGPPGRRHVHRRGRAAGAPQVRDHGHLGEDDRDRADRPGGPDLPGQHPGRHQDHVLRPRQQDRRGRDQGGAGDRHRAGQRPGDAAGAVQRQVLRGAQDGRQAARLRRPLHQARTSSATRSSGSSAPTSTATASRTRRSTSWSRRR